MFKTYNGTGNPVCFKMEWSGVLKNIKKKNKKQKTKKTTATLKDCLYMTVTYKDMIINKSRIVSGFIKPPEDFPDFFFSSFLCSQERGRLGGCAYS